MPTSSDIGKRVLVLVSWKYAKSRFENLGYIVTGVMEDTGRIVVSKEDDMKLQIVVEKGYYGIIDE